MNRAAYNAAAPAIEDSIAVMLDGRDGLREVWLYLRRLERRGLLDANDAAQAQRHLTQAMRGQEEGLRLARQLRGRAGE